MNPPSILCDNYLQWCDKWDLAMIAWAPLRIQGILGSAVTKICSRKNDLPTQRYLTPLPSVPGQYFLYVSVPQIQWVPLIFRNKPLLGIMASLYLNFPPNSDSTDESPFFKYLVHLLWKGVGSWNSVSVWLCITRHHILPTPSQWLNCPGWELELLCTASDCAQLVSAHDQWKIIAQHGEWK